MGRGRWLNILPHSIHSYSQTFSLHWYSELAELLVTHSGRQCVNTILAETVQTVHRRKQRRCQCWSEQSDHTGQPGKTVPGSRAGILTTADTQTTHPDSCSDNFPSTLCTVTNAIDHTSFMTETFRSRALH